MFGDVENLYNWFKGCCVFIIIVVVMFVMNVIFVFLLLSGCFFLILKYFGVLSEVVGLIIMLFFLGYCVGFLIFVLLSEMYGWRWVFYIMFMMYNFFNFLCVWVLNFGLLLVG